MNRKKIKQKCMFKQIRYYLDFLLDDDIPIVRAKYYKIITLDPVQVIISRKKNKVR